MSHDCFTPLPVQMTLYVNYDCNLRCRTCYLHRSRNDAVASVPAWGRHTMPFSVLRRAVDPLFIANGAPSICFMGGEPTLHPQLAEMVAYIKRRGSAYVDINTNGTQLTRVGIDLIEAGIDAVYVSLDGSSASVNDLVRGEGSFDRAVEGIQFLKGARERLNATVAIAVNYVVTDANCGDLIAVVEFCERLRIDEVCLNFLTYVRHDEGERSRRRLSELGYDFQSWKGFLLRPLTEAIDNKRLVDQLREMRGRRWNIRVFVAPVGYRPDELQYYFDDLWVGLVRERCCRAMGFRTTVMANGDVVACTVFPDLVMGNVTQEPLKDIWHGERYREFRSRVAAQLLPVCMRCCDLFDETQGDPYAFVNGSREQYGLSTQGDA